jgi:hypothetical protein
MPDSELVKVMHKAFDAHIRDKLRQRVLEAIEPELNAAIDDAMKAFEVTVSKFRDATMDQTTLRVILNDRRT